MKLGGWGGLGMEWRGGERGDGERGRKKGIGMGMGMDGDAE